MKLKSLTKVLVDIKFGIIVFKDGVHLESFTVDYLAANAHDDTGNIRKLTEYEKKGAEVNHISVNHATGLNDIEIIVK